MFENSKSKRISSGTVTGLLWSALLAVIMLSVIGCNDENMDEDEMNDMEMNDTEMNKEENGDTGMDTDKDETTMFTVTIENLSGALSLKGSGVFNTPLDADDPGPLGPSQSYRFEFYAAEGDRLSLATMFVHSNDLFYATGQDGIALFDDEGMPRQGDLTKELSLYNAGTEEDQPLGEGSFQPPSQGTPNTGGDDTDSHVRVLGAGEQGAPAVDDVIRLELAYADGRFLGTITNVSDESTLSLSDGTTTAAPLAPGVWAVHAEGINPLFVLGASDMGHGLEALAEDGDPSTLAAHLEMLRGPATPFAPGAWVLHKSDVMPLFTTGVVDPGYGLESLAEDGDPSRLITHLEAGGMITGAFNMPEGKQEPGPAFPGESFSFTVQARAGDRLSFATMFGQSNDLVFAPAASGIPLFDDQGQPMSGDITDQIALWDVGTEVNEYPGVGPNQAPRQSAPNTGIEESVGVNLVSDMFFYPAIEKLIRITITQN